MYGVGMREQEEAGRASKLLASLPGLRAEGALPCALAPGSHSKPRTSAPSGTPGREEQASRRRGRRGEGERRGGWEIEKQTLFSARLWQEGSCGP
jgi:hypothetical protein